jgi:hypothetical protein
MTASTSNEPMPSRLNAPLDHHRGGQQAGDGQPGDGDDRDQRVADDMTTGDQRRRQPPGPSGLDEDEMLDAPGQPLARADRREPAQLDREQPDQRDGGHEAGHGLADHGRQQDPRVQQAAPDPGGQAEGDAEADDEHRGHGDQHCGRRGPGGDEVGDAGVEGERLARVTVGEVAQPREVPGEEGVVEVVLLAQGLDRLGGKARPPESVATGSPGARYSDEKIRKLEASSVSRSPASLPTSSRGISVPPGWLRALPRTPPTACRRPPARRRARR